MRGRGQRLYAIEYQIYLAWNGAYGEATTMPPTLHRTQKASHDAGSMLKWQKYPLKSGAEPYFAVKLDHDENVKHRKKKTSFKTSGACY